MKDDDLTMGGYVTGVPYREMRLRMLLTGTNAPTEEQWAEALGNILEELPRLREENARLRDVNANLRRSSTTRARVDYTQPDWEDQEQRLK